MIPRKSGPHDGPTLVMLAVLVTAAVLKADTGVVDVVCLVSVMWLTGRGGRR